ncbi:glycosyltransferase [Ruegeria sp. ANG-S4]|uniref:glycosyltransferase family protein n=1 Tax=Ruegeria sp. ANG-S4 TaxID=1577904 RepID=UPI00057E2CA7|nr:glycosyltransferase [Ruegeria sp. ANG-S4]KIC43633.1 glycosyltransferase [Ruegeria sp. ANG-S4]
MRVMIVVTHLLGTGHLSRALTLGRAFTEGGHQVLVVSGGMPAPQLDVKGLTLLGLPPLRSDGTNFTRLLDQDGREARDAYLAERSKELTRAVGQFLPDILITELFPFGRRILTAEFQAALEAAHALPQRPVILASVRDILAPPSKPAKVALAEEMVTKYYDGVLVHSDPSVISLTTSWPVSPALEERLYYTGFVAQPAPVPHPHTLGAEEILVSAGGGPVGQPIFHAAIEAARKMPNRRWRLLVGGQNASLRIKELSKLAADAPVVVEPVRPDFRQMLPFAAASVSMCGYNTAMDLLQSGTPAVLVPFDDGNEVEQTLRAHSLVRHSGFRMVESAGLTGDTLSDALNAAIADAPRAPMVKGIDGARTSVEIAETLVEAKR